MPRHSRMVAAGYPHHLTQRGNNREPVFFDDEDRLTYLSLLEHYTRKYQLEIGDTYRTCPRSLSDLLSRVTVCVPRMRLSLPLTLSVGRVRSLWFC